MAVLRKKGTLGNQWQSLINSQVTLLGQGDFGKRVGGETLLAGDLIPYDTDRVKDEVCNCIGY